MAKSVAETALAGATGSEESPSGSADLELLDSGIFLTEAEVSGSFFLVAAVAVAAVVVAVAVVVAAAPAVVAACCVS